MFRKVDEPNFITGEHEVLRFWRQADVFRRLQQQNANGEPWSFLDGPITANNPMGVHHAWGRTYKDAFQRYRAMTGRRLRYQNGFDCQGLWVEVEVEKELNLGAKSAIEAYGIDRFVRECKKRVLRFAARQTEQSIRLGYWMEWDDPDELRKLAAAIGQDDSGSGIQDSEKSLSGEPQATAPQLTHTYRTARGQVVTGPAEQIAARLGNPEWGGSYFTFSTENNETIWTFLKKCFQRQKIYQGHDVMPWSGRAGSAYSQMEVADGRRLTTHQSCFVRFPIVRESIGAPGQSPGADEYLLVWTTTPWTLTSNVACAVNPDLEYVKLRAKKDGAVYYFAKDNLEYKRLEREYKEGFGRLEWSWPDGVPKLKTIAQIFKEQGGYEIEGTIPGREMIGWRYEGPFDELDAVRDSGWYRVIDAGRDSKGNPIVVAGEGTGIVHIAPGCGDVDHQIGKQLGLPIIAPLREDGTFGEGFGPFTGRRATDPETAELVFDSLRKKGLLVAVETYPHIYPFCWRTGDELVFRLVDEWFINMDWRDEIKEVVETIEWLPPSIEGRERELEWLTNMRDWMISKKRYWGLALPIWVNPDDPSDFEVIGSLAELKERAVEGWEVFDGHTPHRPWIDAVTIRSRKTGAVLSRIVDVGNPWLDAGIVPFSTLNYNAWKRGQEDSGFGNQDSGDGSGVRSQGPEAPLSGEPEASPLPSALNAPYATLHWPDWYPPEFVVECFPGQFRNWFYSLLALSTMMRYDETTDPREKRPFKTLLGHRFVMNEEGKPMHKSDGTAIWFEEAAEQLGVDTLRWLYLAHDPASDLRFGTRHPDQPVALETPDGPMTLTPEGLPCCRVTSRPADEIRRQILIPLWNSYAFFVNYARLDRFDPVRAPRITEPDVFARLGEMDRWILSNLQALVEACRAGFESFNTAAVCRGIAAFIDDLSNWYIRRNRRRFWRSTKEDSEFRIQDSGDGFRREPKATAADKDKWEAYATLYEVLVTLSKLTAPIVPFLAERMYQNLVFGDGLSVQGSGETSKVKRQTSDGQRRTCNEQPASVHLCAYPQSRGALLDPDLNARMATAQRVVRIGHRLREVAGHRVRQPLAELRFAAANETAAHIRGLSEVIADELNVKRLVQADSLDDLVRYTYKPNLKTLGPKYGQLLGALRARIPEMGDAVLRPLRSGQTVTVTIEGAEVSLQPEDVLVTTEQASDWVCGDEPGLQIALATVLSPDLVREGMARDFVRHVQQARKDANLEITDRIRVYYSGPKDVHAAVQEWRDYIARETLADAVEPGATPPAEAKTVAIGEEEGKLWIEQV